MNLKTEVPKKQNGSCAGMDIFPHVKAYTLVLDDDGRILGADAGAAGLPAVQRMIGTDLAEVLGSYPCLSRRVPAALTQGLREVLGGERSHFTLDYPCLSTPGGRTLRVSATRLEGVSPGRVIFTHSDVTEASRKEDALRLTQFAIDHAADAVFWVENTGRFVYVNDAASRLTGYPKETLLSMGVPDLDPRIAEEGWDSEWKEIKRSGAVRVNTQIRRQDGRMIPIELTADHVRFGDRELSCAYLRDVSERKKLEDQFYQAQKLEAVARLAGGVAHDFNNLLTVINGYSHMLLEQSAPKDPQREFYQEIHDAGRRAAGLTRRLLAFSRKEIIEPVTLDLNSLLRDFERMLRRLLGEDIRILMDLAPGLGPIKADPGQVEQIVMNLAVNARDAMPKGGSLVVQTVNVTLDPALARGLGNLLPGPYVRLVVADTGCGMAQTVLARLFEPFFTTKERGRGTGLGLSTVYGIVQGCGGHIAVESVPDKGTSFSIYIPVTKDPAARAARPEARPAGGRETILLLEDERPVRVVARRLLEGHGYRVFEALSEQEALEIGSDLSRPIDLLLTDMVLPNVSGIEVARRLRSARPALKVLLMSGYTDRSLGDGGAHPAGMGFLQKPFTLEGVAKKVRETLDAPPLQGTTS
jgi:two-component system cell cycle sensor histidine kinase/response regulator CckA